MRPRPIKGPPLRGGVPRERFLSWTFAGTVTFILQLRQTTSLTSRFLPERFAVVVVVIAASLRYPRGAFFLAFLGKMSLTYASLSISFTMVKSSDCIVRSWLNTGIYSAVTIIPTGYEHSCYARTSSQFVHSLLVLCYFQKNGWKIDGI